MKTTLLMSALLCLGALGARADEKTADAVPEATFKEGDVLGFEDAEKLRSFLPREFWENREFFFYEGMKIEIGAPNRDYSEAKAFSDATNRWQKEVKIGRDGALVDFVAGRPFPTETIDCKSDPQAALKIIWNFNKSWNGSGWKTDFFYSYWDRGEQLPLYYKGTSEGVLLSQRVEPQYTESRGDVFDKEKRLAGGGVYVSEPFDARGIMTLSYRYKASDGPLDEARNDDLWVYIPDLRRVRRISSAQRTDSIQGTDFSMDDLRSFNGIPPQYEWTCRGEPKMIHPVNATKLGYPYNDEYNYGPYGFSYANDRWELRDTFLVRFVPKNEDHPYSYKDIWIDKQTYQPLYSAAYDRKKELWKLIWHNFRWTEDWLAQTPAQRDPMYPNGIYNPPWEGVDEVRTLRLASQIIVNVQSGTGNRIEVWNNRGGPPASKGDIRRLVDLGKLNKGR